MEYTYTIPVDSLTGEQSTTIVVRSDGANIPTDLANSDYLAYLATLPSNSSTPQAGA